MIVECPTCGQKGSVPDRDDRRTVRCKRCQESFCVPASGSLEVATNNEPREPIHPLVYASLAIAFGVVTILGVMLWRGDGHDSTSKPGNAEQVASAAAPKPGPILPSREGAALERPVEVSEADGASPTPVADKSLPDKIAEWELCVVTVETDNGVGSGFAVTPGNLIVTNFHVIAEARRGSIRQSKDDAPIPVEVVAVSPEFDLALLRIPSTHGRGIGHYLELADQTPQKGSQVCAIGSPLNLAGTVSSGIVSGIRDGTDLQELLQINAVDMYKDFFGFEIEMEWIQTSAAINHGNSGGPLIDAATSKVVGVNTMTHQESQNVGFAVSADHVRDLLRRSDGTSIAWSDLPISKASQVMAEMAQEESARAAEGKEREQRIATIEKEREDRAERRRQQIVAKQERAINESRRLTSRIEAQAEMSRLNDRAITIRGEIETLETQRLGMQRQMSQLTARGRSLELRVVQLLRQYRAIEFQVATLTSNINNRMIDGIIYQTGHDLEFEDMNLRRTALLAQGATIEDEVAVLQATYAGIASEVSSLQSQMDNLESNQQSLRSELVNLEDQYEQVQLQLDE